MANEPVEGKSRCTFSVACAGLLQNAELGIRDPELSASQDRLNITATHATEPPAAKFLMREFSSSSAATDTRFMKSASG